MLKSSLYLLFSLAVVAKSKYDRYREGDEDPDAATDGHQEMHPEAPYDDQSASQDVGPLNSRHTNENGL